ncbi:MAG: single-stranded-DNA-specific exonuclease RecJ [Alphaproteobacteria bacterium]|nr:single-stranded-DNA-specific exonuclease RecJ [Alphaproteobacteria bacterium]
MTLPFLNVENSFTGRKWVARAYDERMALALAQRFTLPDLVARCLSARGIDVDSAPSFLDPRLRDLLPDPSRFKDMDRAATRLAEAIRHDERVAVFGDFDVDGATSAALLLRFARAAGRAFRLYIPDRLSEGYGPNNEAMRKLAAENIKLVICVDCGTTAHEPLAAARDAGLEVIVIDHHTAEPALPPAVAIVNPNRLDDPMNASYGALAAVGVAYLFVIAVNRALREAGWYNGARPEPDLKTWLDLVALGTVCDVVSLTGLNRAYVTQGLKIMERRGNAGIAALSQSAGLKKQLDVRAAGFILGPRVNAGGRIGQSDLGARLLATDDPDEAAMLAAQLERLNTERRAIEAQVLADADALTFHESAPLVFAANENWHAGVLGIVAARLREKYHRPAVVIGFENGIGKGSGRSIGNIDLGAAVIAARQAGLLLSGGGHHMAAGLTVAREKADALRAFLTERIGKQLEAEPLQPTLTLDGLVAGPSLQGELIEKLAALAPFGAGNPEPRFALADCRIIRAGIVGEKHVSVIAMQGGSRVRGIAFRAMDNGLGPALLSQKTEACHLAGHLRPDDWRGNGNVQLVIEDAAGLASVS